MNNIDKLLFFSEKGYEIQTDKIYTIQWKIVPYGGIRDTFISYPKGHFIINPEDNTLTTVIDDGGEIVLNDSKKVFGYSSTYNEIIENAEDLVLFGSVQNKVKESTPKYNRNLGIYTRDTYTETEYLFNKVLIVFNTLSGSIIHEYPWHYIFDKASLETEYVTTYDADNIPTYTYLTVKSLEAAVFNMSETDLRQTTYVLYLINTNFPGELETLTNGVRYSGTIYQDKVSTEFVAASTFIIMQQDEADNVVSPDDLNTHLRFRFLENSEMKFISSDSVANIIWNDSYDYIPGNKLLNTPIYFSVGFTAEVEGCYQNVMAMYAVVSEKNEDGESVEKEYLMGLFTFLTEVEGEDERYRALLGNLGIPDPIKYPNIFETQDPKEEGVDWTLINTKSKELMLTYDNIFPYVGTYKALLGAIRFLGYYDLVFKEWYKIKDQVDNEKYVSIQTYDLQKGESLQSKLKKFNISFGEYERYKKLNRLTMVYHLNDIDENGIEELTVAYKENREKTGLTSIENGLYKASRQQDDGYIHVTNIVQVPTTYKIYKYRTDEILAKLYSVKLWLEKYILGVNCYISDICGEGIVLDFKKNLGYVTEHHLQDFKSTGSFTPRIISNTPFTDSSTTLTCTLNEFNGVSFGTYNDIEIDAFIREKYVKEEGSKPVYISAPLGALTVALEYLFEVNLNDIKNGTLEEFTDEAYIKNPIFINDNKIMFFDETLNITKIDQSELPIIEIKQGNIRYCHGNWKNNIVYSINTAVDLNTGKQYYTMFDNENGHMFYKGEKKIILSPYYNTSKDGIFPDEILKLYWTYREDTEGDSESHYMYDKDNVSLDDVSSGFVYTAHTKWNIPMLVILNYKCANNNELIYGDYIIEIISGNIRFNNHKDTEFNNTANGCIVKFEEYLQDYVATINEITLDYKYISDRVPIYTFDKSKLNSDWTEDELIDLVDINDKVDVHVNRLGVYNPTVYAYDWYNNIYTNTFNCDYRVLTTPIEIDTIINSEYSVNSKDFYCTNTIGEKLDDIETDLIFESARNVNSKPLLPNTYRIYDIDHMIDSSNTLIYDNISYAMDKPNPGDFIIFNNFSEKILNIDETGDLNVYKIKLLDENPNVNTIQNTEYVGLCIYDNILKDIIADIYPLHIEDLSINNSSLYKYDVNNSYISVKLEDINYDEFDDTYTINDKEQDFVNNKALLDDFVAKCKDTSLLDSSSYFINNINAYVYPATEVILDPNNIKLDPEIMYTYIEDKSDDLKPKFMIDLVIKICYTKDTEIHNNYTRNSIDNECVYRIVNIEISETESSVRYTLDGYVDLQKLNNKLYHNNAENIFADNNTVFGPIEPTFGYKLKMCPAHLRGALYILRVNNFSETVTSTFNNSQVIQTEVEYEPLPLLFSNYLDTTYSAFICGYDPYILHNMWVNIDSVFSDKTPLYRYRNKPITINKGRTAIIKPNELQTKLTTCNGEIPLKINWDWKSYLIDDIENTQLHLDLMNKLSIFKSINNMLIIKPLLLGPLEIGLSCTDVYGNILTNKGDGYIYVDNNKRTTNIAEVNNNDTIYYKDVYIIGFDFNVEEPDVLPVAGETQNYSLELTGLMGASPKAKAKAKPIPYTYKIYYSDGTVKKNEGAEIGLLTLTGKISKTNRISVSTSYATDSHKHVAHTIKGMVKFNKTNKRDKVKNELEFSIPIRQYGSSITTRIYNLSFEVNDIPSEGMYDVTPNSIYSYIKNIKYTLDRSEGETETVESPTLENSYLIIDSLQYIDKNNGWVDTIMPSTTRNRTYVGLLLLKVKFYVNGINNDIFTTAIAPVYLV